MSREHRKNLKRGIKQPIEAGSVKPRQSRHGKPLDEVFIEPAIFKTERAVVADPVSGEFVVKVTVTLVADQRPMTPDEIAAARARVKRATGPTGTWGNKNTPPSIKRSAVPA